MNSFHVVVVFRSGAGGMPCRFRILPTVWSLSVVAQVRQGANDSVVAPGAVLPRHTHDQSLQFLVDQGTAGSLTLCRAVKLLRHELPVPAKNRVRCDDHGHFLESLLTQFLADLGQRLAFAIRQSHTASELLA